MNIIANSCVGGYIYTNHLKCEFQNPFTWCLMDFDSMYHLISNFENINFEDYALLRENDVYSIVIENKVKIKYIHYIYKPTAYTLYKEKINVYSNNIDKYIIECYEKRLNRMKQNTSKPIFILANWFNVPETNLSYEQIKILDDLKNPNIIVGVDKIYEEFLYVKQILRESDKKIYNLGLAKKIYEEFLK